MDSQESIMDLNVRIYFVTHSKNDSSEDMLTAFNNCEEQNLNPEWILEEECIKMSPEKSDVFVMEKFEGETFKQLQEFKCSIVGPRCLISCFSTAEPIPEGTSPVFTTPMRGVVITLSGFSSEKKMLLQQKVEYMGGVYTAQLRNSVTHLVTDSVMSAKYERSILKNIPILTESWIHAVWDANLVEYVKATSSRFDNHKCPVFMNLVVTSTNIPKHNKEELKKIISEHGGVFMGQLDGEKIKIVLAPENSPLSDKLKYALQSNIACLHFAWVYESVKAGHALPFADFLIKSTKKCSTPETSSAHESLNCSGLSTIAGELNYKGYIEESMMVTMSSTMSHSPLVQNIAAYVQVLERLDVKEAKNAGPFLDGCNIYLTGFPLDHREKLNRILNVGSATRLDEISEVLTHVIVGDPDKAANEIKLIRSKQLGTPILRINWLEESIKLKCPANEDEFLFDLKESSTLQQNTEAPSPLSKKNLQLLKRTRRPHIPKFDINKGQNPTTEEPDLVKQYLQANTSVAVADTSLQEFLQPHNTSLVAKQINVHENSGRSGLSSSAAGPSHERSSLKADDSTVPLSQESEVNERILVGLTFITTGFTEIQSQELTQNIKAMGGEIVPNSFTGIPDYGVVPLMGAPLRHAVNEIVTDLFIEDCIDQERVVEVMYYHKPLSVSKNIEPLTNCVIAMSSYTGKERAFLSELITALGGRYQDTFARKTNLEKRAYGCTHLVCPLPEGSKYNAAVKWKLPAVTAEWLKACATQQRLVDETSYLVGETLAPERAPVTSIETQMGPPASMPRKILTPKRHIPVNEAPTPGTPLVNKRLSLGGINSPQSPYHVSTPGSPIGQMLKPDPSPNTKKGWVKWINKFPDMYAEEPPLKRRAPSTPLSELKRQLWGKLKNPDDKQDADAESVTKDGEEELSMPSSSQYRDQTMESQTSTPPINRVLTFHDENSPIQKNQMDLKIAQLKQVMRTSTTTPESRQSLSAEDAKIYSSEHNHIIAKCMVKDSQSEVVGWEDPPKRASTMPTTIDEDEEVSKEENPTTEATITPVPKFMLSGIKDRTFYEEVILSLNGEVSTEAHFDINATHLICARPGRNEKMLASIAAGKWVLHSNFIRDSKKEGKFLDEEKYEWGNPKSKDYLPETTGETENLIASAAHRWRLKLLKEPSGAFEKMVALIMAPKDKRDQFERLICAGGGTVVEARPPYNSSPKGKKITHCFIQLKQLDQPVDWAMMASKGIMCFPPQYLSDHLTAEGQLNPRECVIAEFKKYLSLLPK